MPLELHFQSVNSLVVLATAFSLALLVVSELQTLNELQTLL